MADSDEYSEDSFEFDEAALASIQATEEKFGASLSQARAASQRHVAPPPQSCSSSPPSKRVKTTHGWIEPATNHGESRPSVQSSLRRTDSVDDNPEIFVNSDGSYVLNVRSIDNSKASGSGDNLHEHPVVPHTLVSQATNQNATRTHGEPKPHIPPPVASRPFLQPTLPGLPGHRDHRHTVASHSSLRKPSSSRPVLPQHTRSTTISQSLTDPAEPHISAETHNPPPYAQSPPVTHSRRLRQEPIYTTESDSNSLQAEIMALRAQLSELIAVHATAEKSLREAQDEKFLKAGEVSNLRRTIDKTTREHAEAMAKIKSEKEAAEKVKAELQVKLKEETDRITTRLIFKQQELETSARKGRRHHSSPSRVLGDEVVKQLAFKGFQNAFEDSAPVLTKSPRQGRRNSKSYDEEELFFRSGVAGRDEESDVKMVNDKGAAVCDEPENDVMASADYREESGEYAGDVRAALMEVDEPIENESTIELIDWGEELRRILFTHVAPGTDTLTLQTLLSTCLPERISPEKRRVFLEACQMILGTCGAKYGQIRYPEGSQLQGVIVDSVASSFIVVCELLNEVGCVEPLVALLDLMSMLSLHIPTFLSPFLGLATASDILHRPLVPDGPSRLVSMLENIVQDNLALPRPAHANKAEEEDVVTLRLSLAMAVVELMESLYWNVKDGLEEQLEMISCRCNVLEMLLHTRQSTTLIQRTLRLLVLIATHKIPFQSLASFADTPAVARSLSKRHYVALIEQVCHLLVDPPPQGSQSIRQLIITFISVLWSILGEASSVLINLTSLVPSVMFCITDLSRLLWEDDIMVMNSSGEAKLVVETLYLSLNFIRNLVFASVMPINLTQKLMEVTHFPGPFNGMIHMFMVTFGRLSWAEAPDWLYSDYKGTFEIISELAMEIIESIVVGPEFDSLWVVWHPDEELDDEEFEAQKIQIE